MSSDDKQAPTGATDAASTLDAALEERFGRHFERAEGILFSASC